MQLANPLAWGIVLIVLVLVPVARSIWPLRRSPGSVPALVFVAAVMIWSSGYALELFSINLDRKLFFTSVQYIGVVVLPAVWLVFALQYSTGTRRFDRRWLLALAVEPLAVLALVWTNNLHHLIISRAQLVEVNGLVYMQVTAHGPVFWAHAAYSYLMMAAASFIMFRWILNAASVYRYQAIVLLAGVLTPWIINALFLVGQIPLDLTPVGFTVTALAISSSLARFQLFDIRPVARDLLIDQINDGVVVINRSGRILDANRAAYSLLATETMPRPQQPMLWALEDSGLVGQESRVVFARWREPLLDLLEGGEGTVELNLSRGSRPRWFEVRVSFIRTSVNRITGSSMPSGKMLIFHDIQSRKQAEQLMEKVRDQAVEASMIKSQIIANVSHDLRTPLNAILGFGDMLLDGVYGPLDKKQADAIDLILKSAHQVNFFVGDLLDQSMIERGKLRLNMAPFDPKELVSLVLSVNGPAATSRSLDLSYTIDPELPLELRGDLKRLQQVLMNLVANAVKYTDEGSIHVHLALSGADSWVMEVRDTGVGISTEEQARIFEPFHQVESPTRELRGGAGLGLSIVRHLVQNMGGFVEVHSKLGAGSTFRVILPLTPPAAQPRQPEGLEVSRT